MQGDFPQPEQGVRLTGCGICAVLKPEIRDGDDPCCDGGAHFTPAQMMSEEMIRGRLALALTSYVEAEGIEEQCACIAAICNTIHTYGRPARDELAQRGHSVDALRAVWDSRP